MGFEGEGVDELGGDREGGREGCWCFCWCWYRIQNVLEDGYE